MPSSVAHMVTRHELWARYSHANMPEKFEAIHGKLFGDDKQRLHVLAMLLEAVGSRKRSRSGRPKLFAPRWPIQNQKSEIRIKNRKCL